MPVHSTRSLNRTVAAALALGLTSSVALADLVPVSRTTSVSANWSQFFQGGRGESQSDGTTNFDYFTRSLICGAGRASQTSYMLANGAYAEVSASGSDNGSVMQHTSATGNSVFTYVFSLTAPTTLYINGAISGTVFSFTTYFGRVAIYNDATNQVVYERSSGPLHQPTVNFNDTYLAAAGRYRFVVSAINSGVPPGGATSGARAMLTTPTPSSASLLVLGGLAAVRRKR